jgi:hypothetical protein
VKECTCAVAVSLMLSGTLGCARRESASDRPPAATTVAAKTSAEPRAFRPPADGRLTAGQVERYIAVQKETAEAAAALRLDDATSVAAQLADLATADLRAAQKLGWDAGEYRWVKETVAVARVPGAGMQLDGLVKSLTAGSVEALESVRDQTKDPREKARLREEIARIKAGPGFGREAGRGEGSEDSAFAENRKLLERYRDQLDSSVQVQLPQVAIAPKSR